MQRTKTECLDALREAAERLGKSPTKAEYEDLDLAPSSSTIVRIVGGWNEAKEKADLETYVQGENGGRCIRPKPDGIEIPEGIEWESLTAQQRWYYANREHRIETKERRRRELKRWFYEIKRDEYDCRRCGESRPPALDFHHRNEKTKNVSAMVNDGYAKERIRAEIERCVVLCSNCHRREHYEEPAVAVGTDMETLEAAIPTATKHDQRRIRRAWLAAYKRESGGCSRCSESDPACVDFHHEGEKTMRVGQMVSFDYSLTEIHREIETCELLCSNCHRDEHFEPPKTG